MSELRKLLRYEIPGLLFAAYTLIILIIIDLIEISFTNQDYAATSVVFKLGFFTEDIIIALDAKLLVSAIIVPFLLGWIIYQFYNFFYNPHLKTRSFVGVKNYWKIIERNPSKNDGFYLALIDYLLREPMYEKYDGYAETLRGIWDNYDVVFLGLIVIPIMSLIIGVIPILMYRINICNNILLFTFIIYLMFSVCIGHFQKNKIFEQANLQEFLLLYDHIHELNQIANKLR